MDSILKSLLAMGAPFVMLIAVIILGLIFILARGRKAARALGLVLLSVDGMWLLAGFVSNRPTLTSIASGIVDGPRLIGHAALPTWMWLTLGGVVPGLVAAVMVSARRLLFRTNARKRAAKVKRQRQ